MRFLIYCILSFIILLSACGSKETNRLTIATAANVQYAMQELIKTFKDETGIDCHEIVSSSGKLTAQIRQGAPYDVFVSADMKYPTSLYNERLTLKPPEVYAYGKIVLFTTNENIEPTMNILEDPKIAHIAIANPKTAPYGVASVQALKHYGYYEKIKNKLVYGQSIAQTTQFITSNSAPVGFTAMSVVLSPEMKGKGNWNAIDEKAYSPIKQGATVIKQKDKEMDNATKFYEFLFSKKAQQILEKYGYTTAKEK